MPTVRSYSKEGGIDMSTIPDSWREVFEAAGVSRQDLLNPTTSKEVLKFVGDFLAGTEPRLFGPDARTSARDWRGAHVGARGNRQEIPPKSHRRRFTD
jgi:hypothetical protein